MATLLRAAWLAILLGVLMEALLLLFAAGFGIFPGLETIAADLVRQVSWSTFVCVGLAIGTAVSRARVPLMGVIGVLAAPLAFSISRSLHQGATKALESPAPAPTPPRAGPRLPEGGRVWVSRRGHRLGRGTFLGRATAVEKRVGS
jgi:hypothetical protein